MKINFRQSLVVALLSSWAAVHAWAAPAFEIVAGGDATAVVLADRNGATSIVVDPGDYPVVSLAAGLFADGVQRVTGQRPNITNQASASRLVIVGTLGHSAMIDRLVAAGKLPGFEKIKGGWETTL